MREVGHDISSSTIGEELFKVGTALAPDKISRQ